MEMGTMVQAWGESVSVSRAAGLLALQLGSTHFFKKCHILTSTFIDLLEKTFSYDGRQPQQRLLGIIFVYFAHTCVY